MAGEHENLQIEYRDTARLIPYARNARTHTAEQVSQIAASIVEFGWTSPVLVDGEQIIIAGHARVQAAQQLGIESIPTIELKHLTDLQARAYVLADNRLALSGGWDEEMLALEIVELQRENYPIEIVGFSKAEIEGLQAIAERTGGLTDEEDAPELEAEAVTAPGELWNLGRHRLLCGDATKPDDVARLLDGSAPHLMVTDPPYGVEYDPSWRGDGGSQGKVANDDRADWNDAWALFPGEVAYVWCSSIFNEVPDGMIAAGFELRSQIIWAKPRFVFSRGNYHWQHETAWYCVRKGKTGHWGGGRKQTTVWQIKAPGAGQEFEENSKNDHSTQKPVDCMRRPIENNSKRDDLVYDPFLGSGTTVIAAETTGRICAGLELMPTYCDMIIRRWERFTGLQAKNEAGQTFEERSK